VGDRLAHLRAARAALQRYEIDVLRASSVYETAPQGDALVQGDYLNACVEVETEFDPEALLDVCKAIESAEGRDPDAAHHAPRTLDIDLLLLDGRELDSERLRLPHPDILERRFVLEPLLELDPQLRLPDGTVLAQALARVRDQRVERFGEL